MSRSKKTQPPPQISLRAVNKYLNLVEAPRIENRRLFALLVALAVAVVLLCAGMMRMLPLKERVPYVVQVEVDRLGKETGNVSVSDSGVQKFTVSDANVRYFLGKWAINLLSIDGVSKDVRLPETYTLLKGDALRDWSRFVRETERPLEKLVENPKYIRQAHIITMTFLSERTVMIRVRLTDNQNQNKVRTVQITLNFALVPPQTDEDVFRNPIGIWITTFGVNDEMVSVR